MWGFSTAGEENFNKDFLCMITRDTIILMSEILILFF